MALHGHHRDGDKIFPKLSSKVIPGRVKPRPSVELAILKEAKDDIGLKNPKKTRSKKTRGFGLGARGKKR
jgi:hypothetical protein